MRHTETIINELRPDEMPGLMFNNGITFFYKKNKEIIVNGITWQKIGAAINAKQKSYFRVNRLPFGLIIT